MDNELDEKDMISNEGMRKNPFPFWLWLFFIAMMVLVLSIIQSWYNSKIASIKGDTPFFEVTNRQFSLFLWENPSFMRVNVSSKEAYLPGFQYIQKVSPHPELADQLVQAPPEVLFHYHTWKRLIGDDVIPRVITPKEFLKFLESSTEWQPQNWPDAPKGYAKLVESLPTTTLTDLFNLPVEVLPNDIRAAFIGWMNFYEEGVAINALTPTYAQMSAFLEKHPTYDRNYWRNLVMASDPSYLAEYTFSKPKGDSFVPKDQMTPFFRVALYNFLQNQSKEEQKPSSNTGPSGPSIKEPVK